MSDNSSIRGFAALFLLFLLVLCLLNDYELLIFFRKLFVSILWGPGRWWVLPVGIYVCLGCAWDHYQFLTFSWIIQVVWICKSSWGLSVTTTHQGNSFPLFLLSLGQELWDLFLYQRFILLPVLGDLSVLFNSPGRLWTLASVLPHFLRPRKPRLRLVRFGKCPQCPIHFWVPTFTKS